ncbi:hypothetical protein ACFLSJ_00210 [Verrucomicrobiota bacterium]
MPSDKSTSGHKDGGEIALLFSGGLDTTIEAVERLEAYRAVHLVTFDNGCCINLNAGRRRAMELVARFGEDRIHHTLVRTAPLIKALMTRYRRSAEKARSPLVFDLACKMAGLAELICYARSRGIGDVSDGSAMEQTQIFLQHPEFSAHVEPFVRSCGLRLLRPLRFDMSRPSKIRLLEELGFESGPSVFEKLHVTSQLFHQPFCLRGIVTFFFTSPLRHIRFIRSRSLPMEQAKALWDSLLPGVEEHIERRAAEDPERPGPEAR